MTPLLLHLALLVPLLTPVTSSDFIITRGHLSHVQPHRRSQHGSPKHSHVGHKVPTNLSRADGGCTGLSPLVVGCPVGFGAGTTGGGTAAPVYPDTLQELVDYLRSDQPQVIVLTKEFDFTGSEGAAVEKGCAPWGMADACQVALNFNGWCDHYQPSAPKLDVVRYDKAGKTALVVGSHKTIVGKGNAGVIKGKGLRIGRAENVIVQNVKVTGINPKVVWAGDALDLAGVSNVWIDHVTLSQVGRQMLVLHEAANRNVSLSHLLFDGLTPYSARCDGQHYWTVKMSGVDDTVTLRESVFASTIGRSPQVGSDGGGGGTPSSLVHVVNNVWTATSPDAHAFEILPGAHVLAEGNDFRNVPVAGVVTPPPPSSSSHDGPTQGVRGGRGRGGLLGSLFAVALEAREVAARCERVLGRACQGNVLEGPAAGSGSGSHGGTKSGGRTGTKGLGGGIVGGVHNALLDVFRFADEAVLNAPGWATLAVPPSALPATDIRQRVVDGAGQGKLG